MAVTKTGSSGSADIGSAGPLTYSYTVAGDADCLLVGVSLKQNAGSVGTATVTYNGVAMTEVVQKLEANTALRSYIFRLTTNDGLVTGANNVVVTTSGSVATLGSGVQGFKGVNQTTPISNTATASGNSATASVTVTSASGEWAMDNVLANQVLSAPTQTQDWNPTGNLVYAGSDATGAASVTFQWTLASADIWSQVAVSLKVPDAPITISLPSSGGQHIVRMPRFR